MKKCSHSAHETLTELNITPLLDLAFVLLVIFILTTVPLANDINISAPKSAKNQKDPPHSVTYITVQSNGVMHLDRTPIADMIAMHAELVELRNKDSNLCVIVRGDSKTKYLQIRSVLDACQQANLVKVDLATEAADKK
jgi:biopolymer transport protein ExbD